jgi:lipoprotein-anchoring transpeptidase ErfK/SrfK
VRVKVWAAGVAVMAALTACSGAGTSTGTSTAGGGTSAPSTSGSPSSPAATSIEVTFTPAEAASKVRLDEPVQVVVTKGTLAQVQVASAAGDVVDGTLSTTGNSWQNTDPLAADTTYTVTARVKDEAGQETTRTATFSTLTPDASFRAHIQPASGSKVGVGMPVVVTFNHSIKNKDAVAKAMTVSAKPGTVEGAWHWFGSTQVQWRPKDYWPAGTSVTVDAHLAAVELAPGVWGRDSTSSFTIGDANLNTVDIKKHTLTVTTNGKVVKVIPITTGASATPTRSGIKVIMTKETQRRMDAATTGVDPKDPQYYNLLVKYAMRLTYSGEFLHAAPWSVYAQGRQNVSHGCTGMSTSNALWLFNHSRIGDVVVYKGSARATEWGNGYTAWNMSYDTWAGA